MQARPRVLGSSGLVGYAVTEGRYLDRELPFDLSMLEDRHPRLAAARADRRGRRHGAGRRVAVGY